MIQTITIQDIFARLPAVRLKHNFFFSIPTGIIKEWHRALLIFFLFIIISDNSIAQNIPIVKSAIKSNREKTYTNIVNNSILKNLSLPLTDTTEENWQSAFYALELINYKTPWVEGKIKQAFDSIEKRSAGFQRALLELCYTNYPKQFREEVYEITGKAITAKVFAMAAEYLYQQDKANAAVLLMIGHNRFPVINLLDSGEKSKTIIAMLKASAEKKAAPHFNKKIKAIFSPSFISKNCILYSIQRKNRNYPGIAIIRDSLGNFITDSSGNIFSVPQLARSMSSLPFYLTNGNTPQGIFRMNGFDVSKSLAIGPTTNIQLMMPYETSPAYFLKDSTITDTLWTEELYKRLITKPFKDYQPLFESFYAGKAGRTEIIAHGTTVNPEYYKGQPFYPHTPTEGCLSTKEIWSAADGKRAESNQQLLVNALIKAGNNNGYCVVIEIDDQQKPVSLKEILPYLKNNNMGKSPPKSGLPGKKK